MWIIEQTSRNGVYSHYCTLQNNLFFPDLVIFILESWRKVFLVHLLLWCQGCSRRSRCSSCNFPFCRSLPLTFTSSWVPIWRAVFYTLPLRLWPRFLGSDMLETRRMQSAWNMLNKQGKAHYLYRRQRGGVGWQYGEKWLYRWLCLNVLAHIPHFS